MRSKLLWLVSALALCVMAPTALAAGQAKHSRAHKTSAKAHKRTHARGQRATSRSRAKALAAANPLAVAIPRTSAVVTSKRDTGTACTLPDGSFINWYHCYNADQIRSAYGVDGTDATANEGQGQTIVLVDSYGSPTAASDLKHFAASMGLPAPNFTEVYPNGQQGYNDTCPPNNPGHSGKCGAAGWTGEATLDIEWADAIAPKAHIILLGVPPAETEGVQGLPNLFKAISSEIDATPAGTVFSMSFGITEQTFGGGAGSQTAKFDSVFQKGLAKKDNFFASSGDDGSTGTSKQHADGTSYSYPTVGWPASSPYVTAVGGTQLMDGWQWNPSQNNAFNADGSFNPNYWQWNDGGFSQPTWNESWGPIGSGGGASAIYSRPSWQTAGTTYGNHRIVPDVAWDAAVNGGVDVYITAFPQYNCGNSTGCWTVYGGTSAASPQTAAGVALVNAARRNAGQQPIGFFAPLLYQGVGASDYNDVTAQHYGTAPKAFAGSDVGIGTVDKSVGDLQDNQLWENPVAGYATTGGYDATTGWGTPDVTKLVSTLTAPPYSG
jgi:subtilase family serine protease